MKKKIYFDNNATTPLDPKVADAMLPYLSAGTELYGNPSSVHTLGQATRKAVEEARAQVAQLIGSSLEEIIFTSCGSESDTTAIKGIAFSAKERKKGNHIITTAIEHDTVLFCCEYLQKQGWDVTFLPVSSSGILDPDSVKKAIRSETILVSVMHANNEIGTIQPIAEIGKICKEREIPFHTDAIQTVGKLPITVNELNVDLLSLSAHKLYGPKGVGALFIRRGTRFHPLFHGHHERNRRAGTENVPAIVGLGVAAELAQKNLGQEAKKVAFLRDRLEKGILEKVPYIRRNGDPRHRIPGTSNFSFEFVEGEGCVVMLDIEGIAVSTGSACASGSTKASHVLRAIGLPANVAQGTVRFSLGQFNTLDEVDKALEIIPRVISKLRSLSPLWSDKMAGLPTTVTPPLSLKK
ncbi:MAG: cysteine desulfurase NifS [Elusimicrobia bacterium RIFCSPLOWO2_02_FULL_39_32]|nr:MAG: cysteine desulfurase NifS [Elusimicrobia bacterium GWA2_38_7]OGR80135.1 MAG: cysteine desulfurase NifS [Elusimicrobia bacterium RIFCSPHIGHO2_02_FULL_39_36]OGR91070.1 MAG: cysteine desulfurase NifS [Elusimicrobia bacterium RIFCSPLOWO2_02_FULL_39_32]OGS00037.1 MAG: cysteine desulfurase NifS [Elusimicrobia bacterium RIFCSPLOWO2_12_FULL_39_28]